MRALLVYPLSVDFAAGAGIVQKMRHQVAALRALGVDAVEACSSSRGLLLDGELRGPYRPSWPRMLPVHHHGTFYAQLARTTRSTAFDFVYVRYPFATPFFMAFLADLKRRHPSTRVVLEVPTYPYRGEATTFKQRLFVLSDDLLSRFLPRMVDRVVTFYGQDSIFGVPCYKTTNGISTEEIPVRARAPTAGPVRALGVANLARWHGYDRFIRGMVGTDVRFDIAGDGPARAELERLVATLGLEGQVRFLGTVRGPLLDTLFEEADVAVASLGHHRLGLSTASPLKTREYCARGIPFVLATPDIDFPAGGQYWLQFDADESPIDMSRVVALSLAMRADAESTGWLRAYAERHLSWKAKLAPLVAELEAQESSSRLRALASAQDEPGGPQR